MANNFLDQGIEIIKKATAADDKEEYKDALPLYIRGLEYFKLAAKYEKIESRRQKICEAMIKYLDRAEVLKKAAAGATPKAPADKAAAAEPEEEEPIPPQNVDIEAVSTQLEEDLARIIGLDNVKQMLRNLVSKVLVDQMRKQHGIDVQNRKLNLLFIGNEGTGKSMMAGITARLLRSLGILAKDQVIEATRKDMVAEFVGQTAPKVVKKLDEAKGGVLVIDRAAELLGSGSATDRRDQFGAEAVATLASEMEKRHNLVVIMTGNVKDLAGFEAQSPALFSHFAMRLDFADYTYPQLAAIFSQLVSRDQLRLEPDLTPEALSSLLVRAVPRSTAARWNARAVDNVLKAVEQAQTARVYSRLRAQGLASPPSTPGADDDTMGRLASRENTGALNDLLRTITTEDFRDLVRERDAGNVEEVMSQLDEIIGCAAVKDFVHRLRAQIQIAGERRSKGLKGDGAASLHMIFQGNPGTGKTMVARIIGEMLQGLGALPRGQLVEATRADLVGEHVGETAPKTLQLIDRAMGGVLFIDEAYTLVNSDTDSFGREALDALMKAMEDSRDELVVILAGYPAEMDALIARNPGLKSRLNNVVVFADYSGDELFQIAEIFLKKRQLKLSPGAERRVRELVERTAAAHDPQGGNARFVRNIVEAAFSRQAMRLCKQPVRSVEDLQTLEEEDFDNVG